MTISTLCSMSKDSLVSKNYLFKYLATPCQQKATATNLLPIGVHNLRCGEGKIYI